MPVQTTVKPRLSFGSAGTHVTGWSAANAPVNTRALEITAQTPREVFGLGSIRGTTPGETVIVPTETFVAATFEGVIMNNFLLTHSLEETYNVEEGAAVGVCRYGDIWVKVVDGVEPNYGDSVHLLFAGENAGRFSTTGGVAITGMFVGGRTDDGLAPVELRRA